MRSQHPLPSLSLLRCVLFPLALFGAGVAEAHKVSSVSLISYLDTVKRAYVLDVAMEVVPSEDPALNEQISPEDAAREFAQEYLVVMFDRKDVKPALEIHIEETSDQDTPPELRRRQVLTKLTGAIPEGAGEFLLYLDPRCPMAVVMVVIKDNQTSRRMQVVLAGEYSRPVSVAPISKGDPFAGEQKAPLPVPAVTPAEPGGDEVKGPAPRERPGAFWSGWQSYFQGSGLPWLLAISIFLLTSGRRGLFLQVATLFIAQSLSLALAALNYTPVPDWTSMALVVLIAVISVEALCHREIRWWRLPLVTVAGLLAGGDIAGTPAFRLCFAGDAFSAGAVIKYLLGTGSAFALVTVISASVFIQLSRFEWYRRAVVQPVAVILVGYALFVGVEKFL